jgi:hypothetical protein
VQPPFLFKLPDFARVLRQTTKYGAVVITVGLPAA